MEWRKGYMDLILVPLGLLFTITYHGWLWYKVRTQPYRTIIGVNSRGRRLWVHAMMQDNDKKNILAVQTIRNAIMGSTLMATTSILLCTGLAAVISSTYSVKKPLSDSIYGAQGELTVALKYVANLVVFLFAFLCYTLSIRFLNQVNFLINTPAACCDDDDNDDDDDDERSPAVTPKYVADLLEKGFTLNAVGNRLFYGAIPLLLWIFGPVLVFVCSVTMVPIMYHLDIVYGKENKRRGGREDLSA